MKVKLFTHNDLDGISCSILAKLAFEEVDIEYCDYTNINEKIKLFIEQQLWMSYDFIFITDISVNQDIANLINATAYNGLNLSSKLQLLDHHQHLDWLNENYWAYISIENNDKKESGTSLFYDFLFDGEFLSSTKLYEDNKCEVLKEYVELVRKYDTWDWHKENNIIPKKYNDLFYILGTDMFIAIVLQKIETIKNLELNDQENMLLALRQSEINRYIDSKNKQMYKHEIDGLKVGIVFADKHNSELGNSLCSLNPDVDLIAIVNLGKSISYRTTKDVDVSQFAKKYGGGGHKSASGSSINEEQMNKINQIIFGELYA